MEALLEWWVPEAQSPLGQCSVRVFMGRNTEEVVAPPPSKLPLACAAQSLLAAPVSRALSLVDAL